MTTRIKMEHAHSDIDLQVDNPEKSATNLIEWNVDMKVTVSNVKKSKMFQRSRTIVLLLLVIVFAFILSDLRKEVRALQVKMQSVNVNLLLLMSKYDRLNRNVNRVWMQKSKRLLENRNLHDVQRLIEGSSKAIEVTNRIRGNGSSHGYDLIIPYLNPVRNTEGRYLLHDDAYGTNNGNDSEIPKPSTNLENRKDNSDTNLRIERAIVTLEKQNFTRTRMQSNNANERIASEDSDMNEDHYGDEDDLGIWREPRSGRSRRDEGRGKKRGKNKRRPKRSHRRLGPLVATFVGAIPEQHITDKVYIGPWVRSTKNNTQYNLNKFHLVEDKKSIEVTTTGLYMISAQIFYFGEPTNYSYWILLSSEGKSNSQKLVKCSAASSTSAAEVSCYTSVITPLQRGDRVHIQQQERDRFINMREGHSYIQLVLLSSNVCKKRIR